MHIWVRTTWTAVVGLALAQALGACTGGAPANAAPAAAAPAASANAAAAPASATITPAARAEAEQIFSTRCFTCHGPKGQGDGPASAGLTPPPRNFHDPAWQQAVTDQHIETIIKFGGGAVGKSPAMPPNPDLNARPEVVAGLRQHIRELKD